MLNSRAFEIVEEMISRQEELGIIYTRKGDAHLVDAGVKAKGSFEAGLLLALACMGGLARVELDLREYEDLLLPSVYVETSYPAIATLASQKAGWSLKAEKFFSLGSGPARALAKKPKDVYERLNYQEESDKAVIALEASKYPPDDLISRIAKECGVQPENLYIIIARTSSIAGSVQVSARVVETALYKLYHMNYDVSRISFASGRAPVAPIVGDDNIMMGATNDMIIYGGEVFLTTDRSFDIELMPSNNSPAYGKPFLEIFREADYDFYKINPAIFAPAKVTANFLDVNEVRSSGYVNSQVIKKSLKVE